MTNGGIKKVCRRSCSEKLAIDQFSLSSRDSFKLSEIECMSRTACRVEEDEVREEEEYEDGAK